MNIVNIVLDELKKHGVPEAEVEKVSFSAGKLHAIIRDSLLFNYDVVKEDYPQLKNSLLEFEEIPVVCECEECGERFEPDGALFVCPECSSSFVKLISGKEMSITGIEIKDEQ